jgi:hypothetical protein
VFARGDGSNTFQNNWSAELRNRLDYALWRWPEHRAHAEAFGMLRSGRYFGGAASRLVSIEGGFKAEWIPTARGDNYLVRAGLRTGRIFGTTPLDELWMLGMERDNDLWLRGHAGARDGRKGSAPMGTEYALTQTEIVRKLVEFPLVRVDAGLFLDSGWTGDPAHRFGSTQWLFDTGVQATIATAGRLKLRLVYGRDLRNGTGVFYTAVSR